jgi:virginiamycin B lyase
LKFRKIRGGSSSATTKKRKILIYAAVAIVIATSFVLVIGNITNNAKNRTTDLSVTELNKLVSQSQEESKQKFVTQFCGLNSTPNSNEYIVEYTLPSVCEMPLGIAIDNNTGRVWYISTKNGSLGSFDIKTGKFGAESKIPTWEARENPTASSQVWDVKLDGKDNLWFTDERQNAIWRYSNISTVNNNNNNNSSSKSLFYMYRIPGDSKAFGTTYPVSVALDGKGKIYFVGVRSPSIWVGNISEMKNGTSNGIEQIKIPTEGFKGIDPDLISTGSIALDKENNTLWISLLAFNTKGQIVRYNIENETFGIYDMPQDIRSPVGLALDRTGNLWITDHATNIFYKLDPQLGTITKFVTSRISPRIFGMDAGADVSRQISGVTFSSAGTTNSTGFENAYTLPYWIKTDPNDSLWFNEHEGNKIAMFDPKTSTLIEYWIPTQNRLWGICHNDSNNTNFNNNGNGNQCGIANALQFDVGIDRDIQQHPQVWFSEWSENKIGRILTNKSLPFSVSVSPAELTIRRGSISEVKVNLISKFENSSSLNMLSSGSFTPYGALLNASGTFSQQIIDLPPRETKQISYILTANPDLKPGNYTLMLGADSGPISILKAVYIKVI